jgi:hypothetical protein
VDLSVLQPEEVEPPDRAGPDTTALVPLFNPRTEVWATT